MKKTLLATLSLLAVGAQAFGSSLPRSSVIGEYVEARTADIYTGACFANSEVNLTGDLAVFGWRVTKGSWQGVNLDGLAVVGAVKASATLGDRFNTAFPVKSILIIDERANPEQRLALKSFAQRMSKDLLQNVVGAVKASATLGDRFNTAFPVKSILIIDERANPEQRLALKGFAQRMSKDLLQNVVRIDYQPISLTFEGGNLHSMAATLVAGTLARIETRAINQGDQICHNEETWYEPLTETDHAMPAYTLANEYHGKGLDTTWSSPYKRSAFVASFQYRD